MSNFHIFFILGILIRFPAISIKPNYMQRFLSLCYAMFWQALPLQCTKSIQFTSPCFHAKEIEVNYLHRTGELLLLQLKRRFRLYNFLL